MAGPTISLESELDIRKVITTGSILHINEQYDDFDFHTESETKECKSFDVLGQPVPCLQKLQKDMIEVNGHKFVKKKILEDGGGMPLNDGCTVSIAFSGYWEDELEPFDVQTLNKPLVVDLKDSGLLPGLEIAVRSMLVGETSLFWLSYQVMYGELGIPPRIKAQTDCAFYIKVVKSILTPELGVLNLSEPNVFNRVHHEVKLLYSSAYTLYKSANCMLAIQLFNKAIRMLHKCRLADEKEEAIQEKLLVKMYLNLAICNNKIKKPLKACIACNELNRLNSLWNSGKALLQNAKALRMIGQFEAAERRLKKAMRLCPNSDEMRAELMLLETTKESCNKNKIVADVTSGTAHSPVSDAFKKEVDNLIVSFKENNNLCKLALPINLNLSELEYVKEVCIRENLFFNKIKSDFISEKDLISAESVEVLAPDETYMLDKEDDFDSTEFQSDMTDEIQ